MNLRSICFSAVLLATSSVAAAQGITYPISPPSLAGATFVRVGDSSAMPALSHDPNSLTDRAAWLMVVMLDTGGIIPDGGDIEEFDELDNIRVECKHF